MKTYFNNCHLRIIYPASLMIITTIIKMTAATTNSVYHISAPSEVNYKDPVTFDFTADYTREPYILCSWDFNDGHRVFMDAVELQQGVSHLYSYPGYYTVLTSCLTTRGLIHHRTQVAAVNDIDWLQCVITGTDAVEQEIYQYGTDIIVHYQHEYTVGLHYSLLIDGVKVYEASASIPSSPTLMVQDSLLITSQLQLLIPLGHHNVTFRVANDNVDLRCPSAFTLMSPVSGITLSSSHSIAAPGEVVLLKVMAESGYPAMIEWRMEENGRPVVWHTEEERRGRTAQDVDQITIILPEKLAEYRIRARVYNSISSEKACIVIITQYPITTVFLASDAPINFADTNTVLFSVQFLDSSLPTGMRYSMAFGDGGHENSTVLGITDMNRILTVPHVYTTPGIYNARIHAYNDLSSVTNETTVAVLEPISYLTIRLSHHSGIYFPSSARHNWLWQEPPFIHPIVAENEYSLELRGTGTPQLVIWTVTGDSHTSHINTTSSFLFHQFPSSGSFRIEATASNFFSTYTTGEASVMVLNAIVNLYLISNSPGVEGELIAFVVLVEKLGSNSTFGISYGDGLSESVPEPQRDVEVMQFVPQNLALPTDPVQSYVTILNHTYQDVGVYAPRVTGSNAAMEWVAISYVHIEDASHLCRIPAIYIQDGGSSYYKAKRYGRSRAFIFGASVVVDCQRAKRANYQWRVYKIESLFTVPSPSNEVNLPSSIHTQAADVYIPQFTLGYGMYIFQLTVALEMKDKSAASVEGIAHSYIEVVPADLVARIRGGSRLAIGWYSNITLVACGSNDPDETGDKAHEDLSYTWYCRHDNETFPDNMTNFPVDLQPSSGGCFGNGFLFSDFSTCSSTIIPAQTLAGNQSYVFLLKLSKTGRRSAYAEQTITILPGHPPSIYISCLMNCGSQLNPSARLVLAGNCPDCMSSTQPSFEWTLKPSNPTNTKQSLDWSKDTTTGQYKTYLAINAGTFAKSRDEQYTMRLQIRTRSGSTNFAEYTFTTNSPPTLGSCLITPAEGVVLVTQFSIACEGFEDVNMPLTYEVHAVTGAEKTVGVSSLSDTSAEGTLLFYGVDPNIPPTFLPLGQSSHDFRVDVRVKVTDSLGASVYTLLSAIVGESDSDDIESLALQLTSDEDSKLNQLMGEGNYQSATQVITTVSSMLNQEAVRDSGHGEEDDKDAGDEEGHQRALDEKRHKRMEARESLLNMLSHVEVNSLESIQLTSSAISQVTSEVEEISPQAQVSTASAFLTMSSLLKDQAHMGVGGEAVEGVAKFMVSGLSNIMSSANIKHSGNASDSLLTSERDNEKKQQTRNVTLSSLHALDDVQAAILLNKVPGEEPTIFQTDSLSVILQRQEKRQLDGLVLQADNADVVFRLPAGLSAAIDQHLASSDDEVIDTQIHHFQQNPFSWTESSSKVTSHVTSLKLGHGNDQSDIAVETLPQDVEIIVTNGNDVKPALLQPSTNQQTNRTFYSFNVTNQEVAIIIQVKLNQSSGLIEVPPLSLCLQFEIVSNDTSPQCNASMTMPLNPADHQMYWNSTINMTFDPYIWVIPSLDEAGGYFLTVDGGVGIDVREHILVYAFSTQCLFWDGTTEEWLGDGCKVGPFTTAAQTHCLCNHLTSFAASFLVLPNAIDLTDFSLFANIVDNPVTVVTVATVFILCVLCSVWAHRKDRREKEKARFIILEDNDPAATYRYHVTVFTGVRRGAGTTAVVTLTLQGIVGNSEPHVLSAEGQKVLQRSGIDSFLLTTQESLGILRSVRVWHDNGGRSPEWYLSRILVHDLDKDRWWYFLCHTWIAVDLGDCKIDKSFPIATSDDLKGFHHLFFTRSVRDMKDNHLWFSVLSRPPRSSFTRLQRVACCFSLLLSSMLMNIMFYEVGEDEVDETYDFGVVSISLKMVVIAIESSLLALPINLAIVQIFREVRPKEEEDVEIRPASRLGEMHDEADQVGKCEEDLELQAVALSEVETEKNRTSSRSLNVQSQSSGTTLPRSGNSAGEESNRSCSVRRKDNTSTLSRESLPEREYFNSDIAYEEYMEKYAEFVYLRSTCNTAFACKQDSLETPVCNKALEVDTWHTERSMVPSESNSGSNLVKQDFRPDLLPECDQALLSGRMRESQPEMRINKNRNRSSSESSIEPKSSQSNQTSHSTSSIHILISPPEESDSNSPDSVIYTTYQEFLSSRLNVLYKQLHNPPASLFTNEQDRRKALRKFKLALALHGWKEAKGAESSTSEETPPDQKDEVQRLFAVKGLLPWWCVYIGWFLVISTSLFAAYLIILYGLTFGRKKSIDWLVSMIISLFQSIVVIQPVKVIAIAAFFAIVLKSFEHDDIGVQFFSQLKRYTGHQQSSTISTQTRRRDTHFYQPPPSSAVEQAREKRQAESKMYSLIKAFIGQVLFVWLVLQVSIAQRDPGSIYLSQAMKNSFTTGLHKVKIMPDVFVWIKEEFAPSLYGDEPMATLQDSFLVGSPRLRQLRVKPERCTDPEAYQGLRPGCHAIPSTESDQGSYNTSWTPIPSPTNTAHHQSAESPWVYQSWRDAKGSFFLADPGHYDRGGFIADLGMTWDTATNQTNLLWDSLWIDQYTKVLTVEWVTYNANINLFCVSTVIFRAEGTTGVVPSFEFAILRIYRYTNKYDKFVVILELIYVLIVAFIIVREIMKWHNKRKEYWEFWNYLTIVVIGLSLIATTAYIWQYILSSKIMQLHKADHDKYQSFADIVLLDFILIISLAGVVFCSILKCLKILHYNDTMFLLQSTFSQLSKTLFFYVTMLIITLIAFAYFGHLTFGRQFQDFSDFLKSLESVFVLLLRKYGNMLQVMEVFGVQAYLFFAVVNFLLMAVIINVFVAMLLESYSTARKKFIRYKDHDVFIMLVEWFFSAFSIKDRHKNLQKHNSILALDELY